jgi:hypothetical protein
VRERKRNQLCTIEERGDKAELHRKVKKKETQRKREMICNAKASVNG